jgi:DNA-binding SARP family transcriptional activator/tetratricopeptide (TPR) repeat protein
MEFGVLGAVEARIDGRPVPLGHTRQRGVLAVLIVEVDRPVLTDQLIARVWGDRSPEQARATLHGYISLLRRALADTGEARIGRQSGGYVLETSGTAEVDLHTFRRLVTQARRSSDADAAASLHRALRLWRGDAFADMDSPWVNELRDSLDQERFSAQLDLIDIRLRMGQHSAVLPELSALAAAHPLDERVAGQLMVALHHSGRPADALGHYRQIRQRLIQELGIGPGPALQDVEATILRQDAAPDRAPAPATRPGPIPAQLPMAVLSFVGRAAELAQLDDILAGAADANPASSPSVTVVVVSGTAGVGKTSLALHWAHRVAARFPDGQLYANLRGFDPGGSVLDPADAARGFLDALGVGAGRIPADMDARTGLYRSLLAGKRMLVVLDNALEAEQVRPLLPGARGCLVVVTSRNELTPLVVTEGARPLNLDLLTVADAHELLAGRLGAGRVAAEPGAAAEIVARCARLPLALAVVAARAARKPQRRLAELVQELRDMPDAAGELDTFHGGDPASDVRTVFSWSYRALSTDAARLFRLLGLRPGPDITALAAASLVGLGLRRTRALLTELTRAHLVTEQAAGRYTSHDLLRAYATELAILHDADDTRHAALHRMLDHYLHSAHNSAAALKETHFNPIVLDPPRPGVTSCEPATPEEALLWFTTEHAVLLGAVRLATDTGFDTHTWRLAWAATHFFVRCGHWSDNTRVNRASLDAARRLNNPLAEAHAHHGLAFGHARSGHFDDAEPHLQSALRLFAEAGDHTNQARIHLLRAWRAEREGDQAASIGHAERAIELYGTAGNQTAQTMILNDIGWCHAQLGNYQQALAYCVPALGAFQETGELSGEAAAWDSLGYIHHRLGDHQEAVECYQRSIEQFRALGDRYNEAITLSYLGDTQHSAGCPAEARRARLRAVEILSELGHPDADRLRATLHTHAALSD